MSTTAISPSTSTAAALRNTTPSELANPSSTGLARTGSACARNDESFRSRPPPRAARIGAFAGSASTAGSRSRAWNAGSVAAARNASPTRWATVENSSDRNTAVPTVPPICRKNVADAVATPMSRGGIAFCTASTRGCMMPPSPQPVSTMISATCQYGVSMPIRESNPIPMIIRDTPSTGQTL